MPSQCISRLTITISAISGALTTFSPRSICARLHAIGVTAALAEVDRQHGGPAARGVHAAALLLQRALHLPRQRLSRPWSVGLHGRAYCYDHGLPSSISRRVCPIARRAPVRTQNLS